MNKPSDSTPEYGTYALMDTKKKTKKAHVSIATEEGVTAAKRFSEENQK